MARTVLCLALAAVLLLAGCNGVLGGSPAETPDAATATPESVSYPPGVTDDGVEGPFELVRAHESAASNRSFVANVTHAIRYPNGTEIRWTRTNRHSTERGTYHMIHRTTGPAPASYDQSFELWANDSVSVGVVLDGGERQFFRDPDSFAREANRARLLNLFTAIETTVTGTTTRDRPLVHLLGTGEADADAVGRFAENASNVSFSAAVTPEGVVRSYTLRYEGTLSGERVTVTEEYRLEQRARVDIERPEWVSRAIERTGASPS